MALHEKESVSNRLGAVPICDPKGPSARVVATIGGPESYAYEQLETYLGFGTVRINLAFCKPSRWEELRALIRYIDSFWV